MDKRVRYISKINRNYELYKRKESKDNKLNTTDSLALHLICKQPGLSQDTLADLLGVDKGLVTKTVKYLEELSLIKRVKHPKDKRVNMVYPTAEAEEMKHNLIDAERTYYTELFKEFTEEEYELFLSLLTKIYKKSIQMRKRDDLEKL